MALTVGTPAPDFTLKSMTPDGMKDVTLSSNFGKHTTVLLFVPGAFTGVCTQQLCDISESLSAYSDLDAVVYCVSVDSPFAQDAWAKAKDITVPLLSDFARKVIQDYDVSLPDFAGLGAEAAKRAVFIIDKQGTIQYVQVTPSPSDMPDMDDVKAALKKLSSILD